MPPPPPQPTAKKESDVARKTSPIAFIARMLLRPTRFLRAAKTLPNKPSPGSRKMKPYPIGGAVAAAETVKVDPVVDPALIVEGLNAQVSPALVEQLRETGLLNPPTAAALTVTLAEPPGARVTL